MWRYLWDGRRSGLPAAPSLAAAAEALRRGSLRGPGRSGAERGPGRSAGPAPAGRGEAAAGAGARRGGCGRPPGAWRERGSPRGSPCPAGPGVRLSIRGWGGGFVCLFVCFDAVRKGTERESGRGAVWPGCFEWAVANVERGRRISERGGWRCQVMPGVPPALPTLTHLDFSDS